MSSCRMSVELPPPATDSPPRRISSEAADDKVQPPTSPTSPRCISPEAIDEKLVHYVQLFGSRWAIIRCHMQSEFCCSFSRSYLERRWDALQEERAILEVAKKQQVAATRSPLATMDDLQTVQNRSPCQKVALSSGIQERLPLQGLPKPKRWRETTADSPVQPVRPPPPASPRTPTKALFAKQCPTFLLSPDSSLAAPDSVRRQLKAVYLASLLAAKCAENGGDVIKLDAATPAGADGKGTEAPSPFASDEEKHAVCRLIARELAGFKRNAKGHAHGGATAGRSPRPLVMAKPVGGGSAPAPSQLARVGTASPSHRGEKPPYPGSPRRWPKLR